MVLSSSLTWGVDGSWSLVQLVRHVNILLVDSQAEDPMIHSGTAGPDLSDPCSVPVVSLAVNQNDTKLGE